jgi:hypothetical protein
LLCYGEDMNYEGIRDNVDVSRPCHFQAQSKLPIPDEPPLALARRAECQYSHASD